MLNRRETAAQDQTERAGTARAEAQNVRLYIEKLKAQAAAEAQAEAEAAARAAEARRKLETDAVAMTDDQTQIRFADSAK